MRQDKVIFDGPNPFNEFSKCKELTVLLSEDKFIFVGTVNSIHLMATFKSIVRVIGEDLDAPLKAYTVPLTLILSLFKLDTKEKENVLVVETSENKVTITYNGVSVDSDMYSPNGLTIQQIESINTENSMLVDPFPFIQMLDVFGITKDNFCNVDGSTVFMSDGTKCIIHKGKVDYGKKFSLSIQFIRLLRSMACDKLFIGDSVVGQTKSGVWIVTNLMKLTDPNVLLDYEFARRIKSDERYSINLQPHLKKISLATQSAELSATLDLKNRRLEIYSNSGERVTISLTKSEVSKEGEEDTFFFSDDEDAIGNNVDLVLTDARLIKSLASFRAVRVKVCPTFLIAKLGDEHKMLFNLSTR